MQNVNNQEQNVQIRISWRQKKKPLYIYICLLGYFASNESCIFDITFGQVHAFSGVRREDSTQAVGDSNALEYLVLYSNNCQGILQIFHVFFSLACQCCCGRSNY